MMMKSKPTKKEKHLRRRLRILEREQAKAWNAFERKTYALRKVERALGMVL